MNTQFRRVSSLNVQPHAADEPAEPTLGAPPARNSLTKDRLAELLSYDPETGVFIWKASRFRKLAGTVAGYVSRRGYIQIKVDRHIYEGHRLAWLYMTGEWPKSALDHKDRIKANNRIANLRLATNSQNGMNKRGRTKRSGFKGVYTDHRPAETRPGKKWRVTVFVGAFDSAEDAARAYDHAIFLLWGEFAFLNFPAKDGKPAGLEQTTLTPPASLPTLRGGAIP